MITSEIYYGSGIGNQIWHYIVTRLIAERNGYSYGIMGKDRWKGQAFMPIDFGEEVIGGSGPEGGPPETLPEGITNYYKEHFRRHPVTNGNVGLPDPTLLNVPDGTKIEGTMQRMSYIEEHRERICDWLSYDESLKFPEYTHEDCCVIQFRGGDYLTGNSALPPRYYEMAMDNMRSLTNNGNLKFYVVTDDPTNAKKYIPEGEVVGSAISDEKDPYQGSIGWYKYPGGPIGIDYAILNQAENVIVSSSTFGFFPAWTNRNAENVIAPKYWFDWNASNGWWRPSEAIVDDWLWMDRDGGLDNGPDCREQFEDYKKNNPLYEL